MNQFIVPQFIDVEPKILGPLSVRQFVLSVTGGVIVFLSFKYADFTFFLFMTVVIAGIVFLFGFLKVNGAPFHVFLLNLLTNFRKPKLRVWNKFLSDEDIHSLLKQPPEKQLPPEAKRKAAVSKSRLAELSLIVDTRGEYKGE